ncbi:MAG: dTDP-4-dehydrorhamnose 3,5-epimerase [Defluviitaleaceae bacterium]|nr:dTDP-4-dehydrorhamnose 3,5-epimerase [Defluviitaleaceae bacterium]
MKIVEMDLAGAKIIEPDVYEDNRGFFYENYSMAKLSVYGITDHFVQDNHTFSRKAGTLRGLHFQLEPYAQAKIIRCTRGKVLDVVVDIRVGSPTYGKWVSVELSADNFKQVYIPKGFAHGFLTLTDDVELQYKASNYYSPDCDRGIRWNDFTIGIEWGITNPILSDKDKIAPFLTESENNFTWSDV